MEEIRWNTLKNERLKKTRGLNFKEILQRRLVDIIKHPANPHQRLLLFEHKSYIWIVPCLWTEEGLFLKTLYPSRKYTKIYRKRGIL